MKALRHVRRAGIAGILMTGLLAIGAPAFAASATQGPPALPKVDQQPAMLSAIQPVHQLTRVGSLSAANKPVGVPDNYVVTPNGYFAAECVHTVHANETLLANHTIRSANGLLTKVSSCTQPRFTAQGVRVSPDGSRSDDATIGQPSFGSNSAFARGSKFGRGGTRPPRIDGYVETSNYVSNTPIGWFAASWNVPAQPNSRDGQVIYMFPGLEQLPNVKSILQPVLGWNGFGDKAWSLTSWNCCANGTTFHSDPVPASPGDKITGYMVSTCGAGVNCSKWEIFSYNENTRQASVLYTNPYADLNWVFGGALEVYGVDNCAQYPATGSVRFYDIRLYDRNFNRVANAPFKAEHNTGSLNPQCNYGATASSTDATLYY